MRQRRREATVNDKKSPKVHRREDRLATVQKKLLVFALVRCKSAELFFPC
jgi:hypothetical protein